VSPVKYEMGFYIPEDTILHHLKCSVFRNVVSFDRADPTARPYLHTKQQRQGTRTDIHVSSYECCRYCREEGPYSAQPAGSAERSCLWGIMNILLSFAVSTKIVMLLLK
jgi:hypothetical protein